MALTLFHNPRCSKSRQTKALLEERGATFTVIEYLKTPPDAATLARLVAGLDQPAIAMVRTGDAAFADTGADPAALSADEVVALLAEHPALMQRPVLSDGERSRIGRPPEAVLALLEP